jgi:CRISPR-associated protein Csd1
MILQALVDYYDILAKAGQISRPGYCRAGVSFALSLSDDGELVSVVPLKQDRQVGKKTVEAPQPLEVPEQAKRSVGISSNFMCDNSGYVLGIDAKGKPERTRQCFEAFKRLHHNVLDDVESVSARAVLRFLDAWEPDKAAECAEVWDALEALTTGGNIVFRVSGDFAQDDPAIRRAWEAYRQPPDDAPVMQCLVTGRDEPVARLHPSIKGVKGGQPMGVSIVSFNARAYESYGRDEQQGLNAPVGSYATFAYTTALNYLLADTAHKQTYGDTTVVYWAYTEDPLYSDIMSCFIDPPDEEPGSNEVERLAHDVFSKLVAGEYVHEDAQREVINLNTPFYVLGLAPNAARLSIRFFLTGRFGQFVDNMKAHHDALEIEHAPHEKKYLPLWRLMQETVSPKAKDKAASPLLAGAVLRSIFAGQPYPELLFNSVMVRIRAERDVSRGKAAIIKAYLLKNCKEKYKEVLKVSLNEEWNDKAYLLGRLFAVLEKIQLEVSPGINATIKDKYFASACATPANAFAFLLKLNMNHLSKMKKDTQKGKLGYYYENMVADLQNKIEADDDAYPIHLTLQKQGIFILGYYHQTKAFYTKKDKEEK